MEAAEQAREAAVGTARPQRESGFESARIARFLLSNSTQLEAVASRLPSPAASTAAEIADRLRQLAAEMSAADISNPQPGTISLEETDRTLTVLEEKLFSALLTATPEAELVALRA